MSPGRRPQLADAGLGLQVRFCYDAPVTSLRITRPDDWHVHVNEGSRLQKTVCDMAGRFSRGLIIPPPESPIFSVADALAYRDRIIEARPQDSLFQPYMAICANHDTPPAEIEKLAETPDVLAVKLYTADISRHRGQEPNDLDSMTPVFDEMEAYDVPLLIYDNREDSQIDIFDREARFTEGPLSRLRARHPKLRIVVEHISTKDAIRWTLEAGPLTAATITVHHLLLNRNILLDTGIRPHYYCSAVLQSEPHRLALLEAATSGSSKFFLGTSSMARSVHEKEWHGRAGIYTAHAAVELCAEAFESVGALEQLEAFTSHHGADFFRLPRNDQTLTLTRERWLVPDQVSLGEDDLLVPFHGGKWVSWRI